MRDDDRPITVLIHEFATGGGFAGPLADVPPSWLTEGAAMRRALVAEFAAVPGVLVAATRDYRQADDPDLPATRVMQVDPAREWAMIRALAPHCDSTLIVAPETSGELHRRALALYAEGLESLGSDFEAIDLTTDKLRLAEHLDAAGVPTPPSVRLRIDEEGWTCPWPGPVVVKPVDGAGAIDTFLVQESDRWPDEVRALAGALVQPFVPGEPLSVSLLIDATGGITVLAVGRQRIEVQDGRIGYGGGCLPVACDPADLAVAWRAVRAVPGLRGFVGVDFVRNTDAPAGDRVTIIEINPRPTTSLVGLVRLWPPGTVAAAWLEAMRGPLAGTIWPERLARIDPAQRIFFGPDGSIIPPAPIAQEPRP